MTHVRIIAEIGINHDGAVDKARGLAEAAAEAGVWGIKFQYRNLANAYAKGANQIGDEILLNEIRRTYLSPEQLVAVAHHAHGLNLAVGISFFTPEDMEDFGTDVNLFDFFKVPSVEFTNIRLIKHLETFGKLGLISTGTCTEATLRSIIPQIDAKRWIPLHCISNYPVAVTNPKLGYLKHLRQLWGGDVGYSSHDEYWETCLLALQLGATIVERHITFDKAGAGLDHSSSSTPAEFAKLVNFADNLALIQAGDGPRVPNQGELLNLQNLGRSFYATAAIAAGEKVTSEKIVPRAPRTGLGQEEIGPYLGRPAIRPITAGAVIDRSVFEPPLVLPTDVLAFARAKKLSVPVRFHDFRDLEARLPVGNFEFHMSFGDIETEFDIRKVDAANAYSIHLPDYISSTELMDPFSPHESQRQASLRALARTANLSKALADRTGKPTPIVGSFSVVHTTLADFYRQHADLISEYRKQGVSILPQWLPPVAWYFGGAVKLEALNNVADIAELKAHQLPFCMDVCHLCMGDKVFDFTAAEVIKELAPLIGHIHLADALGYDGEGMRFGRGDPENRNAIAAAMAIDCVKVVEVWQGHLHGGSGFVQALIDLKDQFGGR